MSMSDSLGKMKETTEGEGLDEWDDDELRVDLPVDVEELANIGDFRDVFDEMSRDAISVNVVTNLNEGNDGQDELLEGEVSIPGLRDVVDPDLDEAGRGKEKLASEHNNDWSLKRANALRKGLRWDVSIPLGDLPLADLDELFSILFSRVTKIDGTLYPSNSLMNMLGGYNRIMRRASDLRSLKGQGNILDRDFNIKTQPAFTKTRLVLTAALRRSANANKKPSKVEFLTEAHEQAILADVDHQISSSYGCQKRLAFFCLVRLGIRGDLKSVRARTTLTHSINTVSINSGRCSIHMRKTL